MNVMGKLNASTEIIAIQGPSDMKKNAYKFKTNFRPKKTYKQLPYCSDPLLVPRVKQYLEDHKTDIYVDIDDMVNELQRKYRDYAKRKRVAFKTVVEKAFSVVLQSCGLAETLAQQPESEESSEEEIYSDDISVEGNNVASDQLMTMYMSKHVPRVHSRGNEDKELINISSDEDEANKKGKGKENTSETHPTVTTSTNATPASQISSLLKSKAISVTASSHTKPASANPPRAAPLLAQVPPPTPAAAPVSSPAPIASSTPAAPKSRKRKAVGEDDAPSLQKKKREVVLQESKVTFKDVGGISKVLKDVCKLLVHIRHPEVYEQLGVSPPRGFLLHGPPGCGKTLLANAIAGELAVPLVKVAAPELVAGVSGESEERIRDLFDQAASVAPCILFIDEIDAITPNRHTAQREMERRIVAQLLSCLDDLSQQVGGKDVLVIGATNRPEAMDPALRRAGRFDREVCLGIPDEKARSEILKVLCTGLSLASDFDFDVIARNTPGFVGADLMALTREAAIVAVDKAFGDMKSSSLIAGDVKTEITICPESDVKTGVNIVCDKANDVEKCVTVTADINFEEGKTGEKEKTKEMAPSDGEGDGSSEKNETKLQSPIVPDEPSKLETEGNSSDVNEELKHSGVDSMNTDVKKGADKSEGKMEVTPDDIQAVQESTIECTETQNEIHVNCKDGMVGNSTRAKQKEQKKSYNSQSNLLLEDLLSWLHEKPPLSNDQLKALHIEMEDFLLALKHVQPSAKREGFATVPDVTWDDVGSLQNIRQELQMSILAPVRHSEKFAALGLSAPTGVLLCGPPGCGKTLLAKAVANEAGINFISVKGPELLNMYVGESERAVRQCFQRARNSAPCVIFFDELDALCPKRSDSGDGGPSMRVVNQMLTEMDGIEGRVGVYLMAASNRPDIVDPAVLRPGRLDKILYVGLPGPNDRVDILKALTKGGTKPCLAGDVNLEELGCCQQCEGYTGADLAALVREAGVEALKEYMTSPDYSELVVANRHFKNALRKIRPSVTEKDQKHYDKLSKMYSFEMSQSHEASKEVKPMDTSHPAS
ncbi:nuclear valosin-containing protein-like [Anabrus simplex]|uniref:nuclear valosin-containing protein-like n=1 Tax=Anabrus simplex TaxID=316456 RepID=UPI0035A284E4